MVSSRLITPRLRWVLWGIQSLFRSVIYMPTFSAEMGMRLITRLERTF